DGDLIQCKRPNRGDTHPGEGEEHPGDQGLWIVEEGDLQAEQAYAEGEQPKVKRPLLEELEIGGGGDKEDIARQLSGKNRSDEEEASGDEDRPRPRHRLFMLA